MRIGLSALGILLAMSAVVPRADAAPSYRYCAEYGYRGDMTCAYHTFEQCLASASGVACTILTLIPAFRSGMMARSTASRLAATRLTSISRESRPVGKSSSTW